MVWSESHSFWWLIPLLMIFLCLLMCVSRRRAGLPGCCGGWVGPRGAWRGSRPGHPGASRRSTDRAVPDGEEPGIEGLRSAVEHLETRLRTLEQDGREKKLEGGRR